ncbi:Ser-Thr-rich glycosyl-phosphatidyl-inositol-anchored membrane family-domain-containing protein [Achaetomium macrosporum]|uniref:Ser-Thr-rich glycosyl-phosphatidyl-inositol-anchored membrane family-domain-containing protein n=1 Tax=Achaetomium macrosporum TaxID=79813 RepID=A0AAN7C8W5_9PEZI|nr:Ser-Thr-rich glycosyl-phosphatidyl-inositol-anchored membrane family-domain-containing protein [Achaetomium macrosporum]
MLLAQLLVLPLVLAAVSFTNTDYYVYPNVPFTITWTDARGPVNITLMNGPDEYLKEVLVIVAAFEGAKEYTWTPPPTVPPDSYILRIEDGGSTDYSPRFTYPGPVLATTSTHVRTTPHAPMNQ